MATILKRELGYWDTLPCGIYNCSAETRMMLFNWADLVIVVGEQKIYDVVPEEFRAKTVHIDVGLDVWDNPRHPDLWAKLRPEVERLQREGTLHG